MQNTLWLEWSLLSCVVNASRNIVKFFLQNQIQCISTGKHNFHSKFCMLQVLGLKVNLLTGAIALHSAVGSCRLLLLLLHKDFITKLHTKTYSTKCDA